MATIGLPAASARRAAAASSDGVMHGFQEQADDRRRRVVHQEIHHPGDAHVGLVAGGNLIGQARRPGVARRRR